MTVPAGAARIVHHYDPTQPFVRPLSLNDWLPQEHTTRLIAEVVDELFDFTIY